MKATVLQANFAHALNLISRIVSTRTTLPVLGNILIEASKGKLVFSATDLEIAVSAESAGKVDEEGKITIPARLLIDFVVNNNDENISLSLKDLTLTLKSTKYQANIKGISSEEFPTIPVPPKEKFCSLKSEDLLDALRKVVMATANDETRPVLAGVYMKFDGKFLTMAATDSYRLAEKKLEISEVSEKKDIIIPARAMNELLRILSGEKSESVDMIVDENQVFFLIGSVQIVSRLIEGSFPPYEQIIPKEEKISVKCNLSETLSALKMSAIFAKDIANNIKFKIDPSPKGAEAGKLLISSTAKEIGDTTSEVKADIKGEGIEIAFNARYLLDVLNILPGDEVNMTFNDDASPCIIRTEKDKSYTYLVMPLKIDN